MVEVVVFDLHVSSPPRRRFISILALPSLRPSAAFSSSLSVPRVPKPPAAGDAVRVDVGPEAALEGDPTLAGSWRTRRGRDAEVRATNGGRRSPRRGVRRRRSVRSRGRRRRKVAIGGGGCGGEEGGDVTIHLDDESVPVHDILVRSLLAGDFV
jgi:hypothetical protein